MKSKKKLTHKQKPTKPDRSDKYVREEGDVVREDDIDPWRNTKFSNSWDNNRIEGFKRRFEANLDERFNNLKYVDKDEDSFKNIVEALRTYFDIDSPRYRRCIARLDIALEQHNTRTELRRDKQRAKKIKTQLTRLIKHLKEANRNLGLLADSGLTQFKYHDRTLRDLQYLLDEYTDIKDTLLPDAGNNDPNDKRKLARIVINIFNDYTGEPPSYSDIFSQFLIEILKTVGVKYEYPRRIIDDWITNNKDRLE